MLNCITLTFAQTTLKPKLNAISFELGKTGMVFNLAYDRLLKNEKVGLRAIIGSNLGTYLTAITSGGGAYYLVGNKKHAFEVGANLSYLEVNKGSDDQRSGEFIYPDHSIKTYYASANFGYHLKTSKGLFRLGVSPGFTKEGFIPGAYLNFGVVF